MSRKHTYNEVYEYITKNNYQLMSTEYINAKTKLNVICPKGHCWFVKYNNFQQGQRCPICDNENRSLPIIYVKEYMNKFGYSLLSDDYKNDHTKIDVVCNNRHRFKTTFWQFKQGKHRCPVCAGNIKYSYTEVKDYIESFKHTLLSDNYINGHTDLYIKCDKGHIYNSTFSSFKNGEKRCTICFAQQLSSKAEKEISSYIKKIYKGLVILNDRTQIINPITNKNLELDIYLPELNKAIEYNGVYWHSNEYVKYKDQEKIKQCQDKNIDLLVIKEEQWKKDWNSINNFINR